MKRVKLNVNGKEVEGRIITSIYTRKRKRKTKDKVFEWDEYFTVVYIPKPWRDKTLVLIALDTEPT